MAQNAENQRLAEWMKSLGCPIEMTDEQLSRMNNPEMRSIWRHLQAHVMPVQQAQMIKKNVLLARLKKQKAMASAQGPPQAGDTTQNQAEQKTKSGTSGFKFQTTQEPSRVENTARKRTEQKIKPGMSGFKFQTPQEPSRVENTARKRTEQKIKPGTSGFKFQTPQGPSRVENTARKQTEQKAKPGKSGFKDQTPHEPSRDENTARKQTEQKTKPGKSSFKVQTPQEPSRVENVEQMQKEIICLKDKTCVVENSIQLETEKLLRKEAEKKLKIYEKKELEEKTFFYKMKVSNIEKFENRLEDLLGEVECMKICRSPSLLPQQNYNKSKVANLVTACKFSSSGDIDGDFYEKMLVSTSEFPASDIYDGVILAYTGALKSLLAFKNNFDPVSDTARIRESIRARGILPLPEHLNRFKKLVIKNEQTLQKFEVEIEQRTAALEKDKALLVRLLEENSSPEDSVEGPTAEELVNIFVNKTLNIRKAEKMKELTMELKAECSGYDDLELSVESLGKQADKARKDLNEKTSEFNKMLERIGESKANHVKAAVLKDCVQQVAKFKAGLKQNKSDEGLFDAAASAINEETELFIKLPLTVLTRKWEESAELMPKSLLEGILRNQPSLVVPLLQSEPKDILKRAVEDVSRQLLLKGVNPQ